MTFANRPRVLITRALPDDLLQTLREVADVEVYPHADTPIDRETLLSCVQGVNGIVAMLTDKIDEEVLTAAGPSLKVVANMAVGYDNIDVETATKRGVTVTNTPDVLTETTADLAFALMLATARRIPGAERYIRDGQWTTWSPMLMTGMDVYGKTLGIVGLGRIGEAVARRAQGFGMKVLYHNRTRRSDVENQLHCQYRTLNELLSQADFVVVLVPGAASTRAMFGAEEFALMKPTAIFVNVARGTVVDEDALVEALSARQIYAAGLDVFAVEPLSVDHPLLSLDNVVLLPHIGSASIETRRAMAKRAIRNCELVVTGQLPENAVN